MSSTSPLSLEPILTPEDLRNPPPQARPGIRTRIDNAVKNRLDTLKAKYWTPPQQRRRTRLLIAAMLVALLSAGAFSYWKWGIVHRPDFAADDLDDVLNYAMLTDDFNRLPIDERMKLLSELVKRLKSSSSGDSAMLAAFAAGIEGQLRDQFVTNSAKLAVDMFDQYARNYDKVPDDQREKYLEDSFADMTKKMEAVAGVTRNVSDADRVAEVRRQAQRDKQNIEAGKGPGGAMAGRMVDMLQKNVGSKASPAQRGRGAAMMRDMGRYFRNEDIRTGAPR